MSATLRLGIDIGGTKTASLVLDEKNDIAAMVSVPSGYGNEETLVAAARVANEAAAQVGGWAEIASVGVCMPGVVDIERGIAENAVHVGVLELNIAAGLSTLIDRLIVVDNDVKAAGLGALHLLRHDAAARALRDRLGGDDATPFGIEGNLAYLNVGTGLAAALVRNGAIVRGTSGAIGEIGHIPVGTGTLCPCGQTGCLETIASGGAVSRLWTRPIDELFPAARADEPLATEVVATLASGIGLAIQILVLTGADFVMIGGGVTANRDDLERAILTSLEQRAAESSFVKALCLQQRFHLLHSEAPIAAIGAALLPEHLDPPLARSAMQPDGR